MPRASDNTASNTIPVAFCPVKGRLVGVPDGVDAAVASPASVVVVAIASRGPSVVVVVASASPRPRHLVQAPPVVGAKSAPGLLGAKELLMVPATANAIVVVGDEGASVVVVVPTAVVLVVAISFKPLLS
jgi:hypothetical protein